MQCVNSSWIDPISQPIDCFRGINYPHSRDSNAIADASAAAFSRTYSLRLSNPLNPCLSIVGVVGLLLASAWSGRGVFSLLPPPVPGVISKKPFSLSTIVFS